MPEINLNKKISVGNKTGIRHRRKKNGGIRETKRRKKRSEIVFTKSGMKEKSGKKCQNKTKYRKKSKRYKQKSGLRSK